MRSRGFVALLGLISEGVLAAKRCSDCPQDFPYCGGISKLDLCCVDAECSFGIPLVLIPGPVSSSSAPDLGPSVVPQQPSAVPLGTILRTLTHLHTEPTARHTDATAYPQATSAPTADNGGDDPNANADTAAQRQHDEASQGGSSGPPAGPIAGGVVGGVLLIGLIIAAIFYMRRRERRKTKASSPNRIEHVTSPSPPMSTFYPPPPKAEYYTTEDQPAPPPSRTPVRQSQNSPSPELHQPRPHHAQSISVRPKR